ncbi:hypothetical protein BLOT_001778 [Blomia tropicalis]|nr:hypothetical protein BLOT_001778 [Blomia tropicalis]
MEKLECTNHVSKRISARLRKKKNEFCLKGKGKLTEAAINRIHSYYSHYIRSNIGDATTMSKAISAMYKHISSTNDEPTHDDCDPTKCKYRKLVELRVVLCSKKGRITY